LPIFLHAGLRSRKRLQDKPSAAGELHLSRRGNRIRSSLFLDWLQ
jgi:hypothetical protein